MIYLLLIAATVYAVQKIRQRPKRPRLEYRPEWYEPETVELEPFDQEPAEIEAPEHDDEMTEEQKRKWAYAEVAAQITDAMDKGGYGRMQAQIDLEHWEDIKRQYEELQATIKAEIEAIRKTRADKARLQTLADKPLEYMELAASMDKRDYSERREATLQRQLITAENNIYACQKRIAKAQQKLKEVI